MGFLAEIVRETRHEVRAPGYLAGLPSDAASGPRPSLRQAVEREASRGALLVEYKRVSPGRVDPRLPTPEVAEFARRTAPAPIAGYSCLATVPRFEGAPHDVADLVRATERPVLFKDFVIDPVQVEAARRAGASAVLLIARLATEGYLDRALAELAEAARAAGLEVLLEFHGSTELSVVGKVKADMYGVNVRDLDSLSIDRPTARQTITAARDLGLRPLLGFSGVEGPGDAAEFWDQGTDGILIGSAVARSDNPARFLATLLRTPPVLPRGGGPA